MVRQVAERGKTREIGCSPEALLPLALSRPREVIEQARTLLASRPDAEAVTYARQALGIAHRELGDLSTGLEQLRLACRAASAAGIDRRVADIQATTGATLAMAGRTQEALTAFDLALNGTHGVDAARIRLRRAGVLRILGRYEEALDELRRTIRPLHQSGDALWAVSYTHLTLPTTPYV